MIVAWIPHPTCLTDVKRYDDGSLRRAYVENGGWYFFSDGVDYHALDFYDAKVHSWAKPEVTKEIEIPEKLCRKHYNEIIEWAINESQNQ